MVTATRPVTRRNADTLARWDAALKRATDKGLCLLQDSESGAWFCTATDGRTIYRVSYFECTCRAAAEGDPVCQHRSLYREQCRVEDQEVERQLREEELGMTDVELAALLAEPTLPYDPAAIAAMLDAQVPTFDEMGEGAIVLSVPATGGDVTEHSARPSGGPSVCDLCGIEAVCGALPGGLLLMVCDVCWWSHNPDASRREATCPVSYTHRDDQLIAEWAAAGGHGVTPDGAVALHCTPLDVYLAEPVEEVAPCRECKGSGVTRMYTGDRLSDWWSVTCGCQRVARVAA